MQLHQTKRLSVELLAMAENLKRAIRLGADRDVPEGARIIQLTDTLAKVWEKQLRRIAEDLLTL